MKYRDLRDFLAQLERLGELKKVADPVSPRLEMTALGDRVLRAGGPALLFQNVVDGNTRYPIPCLTNLLGSKGVGELGTIGATPAVVNAVVDAVARAGQGRKAEQMQMPLTPEVVWRALRGDLGAALDIPA